MRSRVVRKGVAITLCAVGIAVSACTNGVGGDGDGSSSGSKEVVAAAQERVDAMSVEQPPIEVAPLPGAVEKGLTYGFITCPLPVCRTVTDASVKAAEALGWESKQVETEMTPEGYVAAWDQLLQDPPDVIAFIPFAPDTIVEKQLAKAADLGIPVVSIAPAGDRPSKDGPVSASYNGYPELRESGALMGDVIVADGGSGSNTVFVWDPALSAIWNPIKDGFEDQVKKAGDKPQVLEVSASGIGTALPGQVVSYLQAHPEIKYVAFALADMTVGVPEALQTADLADTVKITSRAPQAANLANVKKGTEWTTIGEEIESNGWRVVDGLARLSLGATPDDQWFEPGGWHQVFTADNVTQTDESPVTPGSPDVFLAAWNVS
jgi:ribose transport system substrate-binding protein